MLNALRYWNSNISDPALDDAWGMGVAVLFVVLVVGLANGVGANAADAAPRWSGYAPSPVPGLGHTATIDFRGEAQ